MVVVALAATNNVKERHFLQRCLFSLFFKTGEIMQEEKQVRKILQQVQKQLPAGSKIVVACSGGADSLALVDALWLLREQQQYQLGICHVEHGLRGEEALADADFVAEFCRQRQLDCEIVHVEAKVLAESNKLSLEDAARKLRYAALFKSLDNRQADFLVTAHHRDDQAETLLLHLMRGSGSDGLSGMRVRQKCLVRPLLALSRQELEQYCRLRGLIYCNDSSNDDLYFTRNKVRHVLLPLLEREFNPRIKESLANTCTILAEDADCLRALAVQHFNAGVCREDRGFSCAADWLMQLPPALGSRIVRAMWQQCGATGVLTYAHTKQILKLVDNGSSNKKIMLPGKSCAIYSYGKLSIMTADEQEIPDVLSGCAIDLQILKVKGTMNVELPDGILLLSYLEDRLKPAAQAVYPWHLLESDKLELRYRQDGDRFFPQGSSGSKKLKKYFNDVKFTAPARERQLLAACGKQVLWLVGGKSAGWHEQDCKAWLTMEIEHKDMGDDKSGHA